MSRRLQTGPLHQALRHRGAVLLLLASGLCLSGFALQAGQPPIQMIQGPVAENPFRDLSDIDPTLARHQLRALNALRQKELVKDTDKLLKLAKVLNAQVQQGHGEALTTAQLKEVKRIEKLAHSVREKMVQTYGGGPSLTPVFVPRIP